MPWFINIWIFFLHNRRTQIFAVEMEKATENPNSETQPPPHPNHQMDADDDDENVKQLKECSSLYLSLQVLLFFQIIISSNPRSSLCIPLNRLKVYYFLQDCLVDSNRDWKSCQKRTSFSISILLIKFKSEIWV